ncbi:hypothetical protein HDV02_006433, partial [Globomyces sp. JEL0801]
VVGMLICNVPSRVKFLKDMNIREWLRSVQDDHISTITQSHASLVDIQKWVKSEKLFNTLFVFENYPATMTLNEGSNDMYEVVDGDNSGDANFNDYELQLTMQPMKEYLEIQLDYDTSVIDPKQVARIGNYFNHVLMMLVERADLNTLDYSIDSLTIEADDDRLQLFQFGAGDKKSIPYQLAHHAFEKHAHSDLEMVAVEHGLDSITYTELNERANYLAAELIDRGLKVGDYVGILTIRSIEMIVAIFAVLKAGGAFIPMDCELPVGRIEYMVEKSNCRFALVHPKAETLAHSLVQRLTTISLKTRKTLHVFQSPSISGESPAYAIFTSGSTGKPKGVSISHLSLSNYSTVAPNLHDAKKGMRIGQFASISFDVCISDIFDTLSCHATLVLRTETDPLSLLKKVDVVEVTPTAILNLNPDDYPKLKKLILGGEPITNVIIEKWSHRTQLINSYGPTEATICTSFTEVVSIESASIGKPMANTIQYIVDKNLQLLPLGVAGELVIGGVGVALGYLNDIEKTNASFIPNHF